MISLVFLCTTWIGRSAELPRPGEPAELKNLAGASPVPGSAAASRPAARSAAAASTSPKPVPALYPPDGRRVVLVISACVTSAGLSAG
jgi:hypothetical protein